MLEEGKKNFRLKMINACLPISCNILFRFLFITLFSEIFRVINVIFCKINKNFIYKKETSTYQWHLVVVLHRMHLNFAFVMVVIVDRHFDNETVMVFRNLAIDDDLEDGVEVVFDVVLHDMGVDVGLWAVEFQFLYTCNKYNLQLYYVYNV